MEANLFVGIAQIDNGKKSLFLSLVNVISVCFSSLSFFFSVLSESSLRANTGVNDTRARADDGKKGDEG